MKPAQPKNLKSPSVSKPLFKPLALPILKENFSGTQPRSLNSTGLVNDFMAKGSPQVINVKTGGEKLKESEVKGEEVKERRPDSRSHRKTSSKAGQVAFNPTAKPMHNLKNFLKANGKGNMFSGLQGRDQPVSFGSPPPPQKQKMVILTAPNSTGKPANFTQKVTPLKGIGNYGKGKGSPELEPRTPSAAVTEFWNASEHGLQFNQYCLNHPEKQVKYVATKRIATQGKGTMFRAYCSTCAVNLTQEGVKVVSIGTLKAELTAQEIGFGLAYQSDTSHPLLAGSSDLLHDPRSTSQTASGKQLPSELSLEEKESCQQKIRSFLTTLSLTQSNCNNLQEDINDRLFEIDELHNQHIDDLNSHFTRIYEHLEVRREFLRKQIEGSYLKNRQTLSDRLQALSTTAEGLKDIRSDVEKHYDKILQKLSLETLTSILQVYVDKISDFDVFKRQTEALQFSQQTLTFPEDFDKVKSAVDPRVQILIKSWSISDRKRQKVHIPEPPNGISARTSHQGSVLTSERTPKRMTVSFPGDDAHKLEAGGKMSGLVESAVKSDMIISFDKNNSQLIHNSNSKSNLDYESQNLLKTEEMNESFDYGSLQGYNKILDKIHQSQTMKQEFYDAYLPPQSRKDLISQPESARESIGFSNNQIFEFENADDSLNDKQTPELGQKNYCPMSIREHYARLAQEKTDTLYSQKDGQFLKESRLKALFEEE